MGTAINPGITNTSSETTAPEFRITESDKDLELKENVAYCIVHPISRAQ